MVMESITANVHAPECHDLVEGDFILFDKIPVSIMDQRRFQMLPDISLSEKLIGKSHYPNNKAFTKGANPVISYEL